jgi:hypothetical protein
VKFEYQAIDENGVVVRGIIEARTAEKVLQILLHKQLHPLDIRHLTDSTVELSRLHHLKQRLEGTPEMTPEPVPEFREEPAPKEKSSFDWTYVVFLLLMIGLIAAAVVAG